MLSQLCSAGIKCKHCDVWDTCFQINSVTYREMGGGRGRIDPFVPYSCIGCQLL